MEKAYAHAILRVSQNGMDPTSIATRLLKVLSSRGHLALMPKITRALRALLAANMSQSEATLVVADQKDAEEAKRAAATFAPGGISKIEVDGSLIGGWILKTKDSRVDASFKKQLVSLYRKITV